MATKKATNPPADLSVSMNKLNKTLDRDKPVKVPERLQQVNKHKVPARKWNNWPDIGQRVFNTTYDSMMIDQRIFLHPKALPHSDEYWKTTAWNAAWTAADACQKALKDITAGVGYAKT